MVSKGKGLPRSALSDRTIMWALNLNWICIFKCFNSHIKRKKADELDFNNTFYLTQHIQNIIMSTGNPYKNVNEILYILFVVLSLWNLVCFSFTVHLNQTSHISNAQWPLVASNHCTGQRWDKVTCVSSEKQLDSADISRRKQIYLMCKDDWLDCRDSLDLPHLLTPSHPPILCHLLNNVWFSTINSFFGFIPFKL